MKKIQKRAICALLAVTLLCGSLCAVPVAAGEDAVTEAVASQEIAAQTEPEQVQSPPENTEPADSENQEAEMQAGTNAPGEAPNDVQGSFQEVPEGQLQESLTKTEGESEQPIDEQPSQSESGEGEEIPGQTVETAGESTAEKPTTATDEETGIQSPATEETATQLPATAETATGETATAETATAETATVETATAETASQETAEAADAELGESSLILVQPFADVASIAARPMRLFLSRMQTAQLNLSKTVSEVIRTKDERGIFQLALTAAAPEDFVTERQQRDIVLVLDASSSMGTLCYDPTPISIAPVPGTGYVVFWNGNTYLATYGQYRKNGSTRTGWYFNNDNGRQTGISWKGADSRNGLDFYVTVGTRLDAIKKAVKEYLGVVAANSPQSRVDIIAFSNGSWNVTQGFLTVGNPVNPAFDTALDAISASGTTNSAAGMQEACAAFSNLSDRQSPVCVLFTDGEPYRNVGWNSPDFNENVANGAVAAAETLKDTYGATVYSVGIFSGQSDGIRNQVYSYMHHVSSNFANCTSYQSGEWAVENTDISQPHDYFRTADSAQALADIFAEIAVQKAPGLKDAVVRDVLAQGFVPCLPDGTLLSAGAVLGADGLPLEDSAQKSPHAVLQKNAEGFWVFEWQGVDLLPPQTQNGEATTFAAKLYCRPAADHPGGNSLATNAAGSGVYASAQEASPLQSFESPQVNVPVSLSDSALEKTIFLGETVSPAALATELEAILRANSPYPLAGELTALTSPGGAVPAQTPEEPGADTRYAFEFTLTPPEAPIAAVGKPCTAVSASGLATIRVVSGQITLTKTAAGGQKNQAYLFEITGPKGVFYEVIQGLDASHPTDTKTLTGLCKGNYTIKEITAWSWQDTLQTRPQITNDGLAELPAQTEESSAVLAVGVPTGAQSKTPEQNYTATTACAAGASFQNERSSPTVLADTTWVVNEFAHR